jgi:hypothetical protein
LEWTIELAPEFDAEIDTMPVGFRRELYSQAAILRTFGPAAKRPHVDSLKGSKHSNMKELRFSGFDGIWRVAFAFDPVRSAILLVAGDKSGVSEKMFYKRLIAQADKRFDRHLRGLATSRSRS